MGGIQDRWRGVGCSGVEKDEGLPRARMVRDTEASARASKATMR